MATAPNTLVVTGPNNQQQDASTVLIQPTGGTQASMADILGGKSAVPAINSGTVTVTSAIGLAVTNSITASVTQTLAGAVALTTPVNVITKVGTAGDAVKLVAAGTSGTYQVVINQGASACAVFPFEAGTKIDGGSAGASVTLTNAKNATFYNTDATNWISIQGGVKSA